MNAIINAPSNPDFSGVVGHTKADESAPAPSRSKAEGYLQAERTMQRGKRLVMSGFVVAVVGIVGYCVACLNAAVDPALGASFLENPGWLVGPALGTIGLGTLLWLVGSFVYLNGAMDSDPNGPNLYF